MDEYGRIAKDLCEKLVIKFNLVIEGDKKELLQYILIVEGLAVFCLLICSFVVASTANMGFNCVLTAFVNIAYIGGSSYVISNSKDIFNATQMSSLNTIKPKRLIEFK